MKECPKCKDALTCVELHEGVKQYTCKGCGFQETVDREGRNLLLSEVRSDKPLLG